MGKNGSWVKKKEIRIDERKWNEERKVKEEMKTERTEGTYKMEGR